MSEFKVMTDEERMRAEFEKWFIKDCTNRGFGADFGRNRIKENAIGVEECYKSWQACWRLCGGMKDE